MCPSNLWSWFRFAFLAILTMTLLLASGSAKAQLSAGSVTGIVRDPTGSVVAKASVTLRNVDTMVQHTTVSNDAGNYVFLSLGPGRYALEASASGFATKRVAEFVLAVNQTASIDISLQVGSQSDVVTISAETEQLDVSSADLGTVIATKQVNDLPLNGRNFTQLLSLTPGVAPVSVAQNAMGGRAGGFGAPISVGSAFIFPAVNGQTNRSNCFLTDGLNNFGSFLSTYAVPPIVDAIQEFKVVSHTDEAQFGSVLGGVVNVVTKSGTNDFHGSAWEYLRSDAFDARSTVNSRVSPFRQNQFGGSFGGPVWMPKAYNGRNRTFFFVSYQGFRYTRSADTNLSVPNATELGGDFGVLCKTGFDARGICRTNPADPTSPIVNQLYNPLTTRPDPTQPAGSYIRDPFPFNKIPSNLINSNLVALAQAIFPPAAAGRDALLGVTNAVDPTPVHQAQNEVTFKIDQNFGAKNSLFFRYSMRNSTVTGTGGFPNLKRLNEIPARNWGGSYLHVFDPSLILQVQYARTTVADNSSNCFTNIPASVVTAVGFSPTFNGGFTTAGSLIPNVSIGGVSTGGESVNLTPKATDSHQVSGDLTKITGNHALHFGAGYTSNNFASPLAQLTVSFANQQTGDPQNSASPGNALASYLINVPDGANRRDVNEKTRPGGVLSLY